MREKVAVRDVLLAVVRIVELCRDEKFFTGHDALFNALVCEYSDMMRAAAAIGEGCVWVSWWLDNPTNDRLALPVRRGGC